MKKLSIMALTTIIASTSAMYAQAEEEIFNWKMKEGVTAGNNMATTDVDVFSTEDDNVWNWQTEEKVSSSAKKSMKNYDDAHYDS